MMGPDAEFMEDILYQVGMRHKKMGVKAAFFPYMGDSIISCLEKTLGGAFTETHRDAHTAAEDICASRLKDDSDCWWSSTVL
eukprot:scaffold3189_cov166-Amphora_coffeaeformis.AAC.10